MTELRYASSFNLFLAATNEKEIIERAILSAVPLTGSQYVLDLGAGDGNLVQRLAPRTANYVAVEMNPDFTDALRAAGATVIVGEYPAADMQLDGQFDLVLSSYSSPIELDTLHEFLLTAWKRVCSGGSLVLITFGPNDRWSRIMARLETVVPLAQLRGYSTGEEANQERHQKLVEVCKQLGDTSVGVITSTIRAKTAEDLFEAVSFLVSAGVDEALDAYAAAHDKVLPVLMKGRTKPAIPHDHTFIVVRKRATA